MAADLTHLRGRVPDGAGHPAEDDRRHAAAVAGQRLQLAARVLVDCLARGDEGAAKRHVQALRLDLGSGVDPWALALAATARAVRAGARSGFQGSGSAGRAEAPGTAAEVKLKHGELY